MLDKIRGTACSLLESCGNSSESKSLGYKRPKPMRNRVDTKCIESPMIRCMTHNSQSKAGRLSHPKTEPEDNLSRHRVRFPFDRSERKSSRNSQWRQCRSHRSCGSSGRPCPTRFGRSSTACRLLGRSCMAERSSSRCLDRYRRHIRLSKQRRQCR